MFRSQQIPKIWSFKITQSLSSTMANHVHSLILLTSEMHQYGTFLDRRIRRYFLDRVSMVIVGRVPLSQLRIGNPDKPIRLRPITQLLSHLSYRKSFDSRQNLYPPDIRDSADEEPTEKQNAINDEKENKGGGEEAYNPRPTMQ